MEVAPRMSMIFLIMILMVVGLFIILVTKFGKNKPGVIGLCVCGFIAAIFGSMFLMRAGHGSPVGMGMIWLPMMVGVVFTIFFMINPDKGKDKDKGEVKLKFAVKTGKGGKNKELFAGLLVAGLVIVAIFVGGRHLRFGPGIPGVLELMILSGGAVAIFLFVMSGRKKEESLDNNQDSPYRYVDPKPKKSKVGLLVGLLVAGVAMAVVLLTFIAVPVSHRTVRRVEMPAMTAVVSSEPRIWHSGVEEQFRADIYPSRRAAVMALGKQIAETTLQASLTDQQVSREIGVLVDDHDRQLMSELAERIKSYIIGEGVVCRVLQNVNKDEWDDNGDNSVMQMKLWVRLGFEDVQDDLVSWSEKGVSSGKVSLTVKGPSGLSKSEVLFSEKPWIENFSEFLSRNPNRQFLLVKSSESCTSQTQAHQQTLSDACSRVSGILRGMQADPSILPTNFDVTEQDLRSAELVVDRFTQRFSGMAGPIWRQALLVDTSESKLAELASKKIGMSRVKRETWGKMAITLIGMFALICLVYFFLNAATRGYYAWALRIAVAVLMVVGVFLVLTLS